MRPSAVRPMRRSPAGTPASPPMRSARRPSGVTSSSSPPAATTSIPSQGTAPRSGPARRASSRAPRYSRPPTCSTQRPPAAHAAETGGASMP